MFTFTVPDHVWTDHEYLTEILMWLIYSIGGSRRAGHRLRPHHLGRLLADLPAGQASALRLRRAGLALAALAGWPIWGPRAQMITFALTCLELYWLQDT